MKQNDIQDLPQLTSERYENIFNVYQTTDGYYYYNILSKVSILDTIDPSIIMYFKIPKLMPWTNISFLIYGTQYLWWLLCALNKIQNPVRVLQPGTVIAAINPTYVKNVLDEINASTTTTQSLTS
jgi:hypothetical protein